MAAAAAAGGSEVRAAAAAVVSAYRKPTQLSEAWCFALCALADSGSITWRSPFTPTAEVATVANIVPSAERRHYAANFGSDVPLSLHRDGLFDGNGLVPPPFAPSFVAPFCLRSDPAATTCAPAR